MSQHRLSMCLAFLTIILVLPLYTVQCQNYFEYSIQVGKDGSALWKIIQFSSADANVDNWEVFQQKIFSLVESGSIITQRPMDVDENSLQINTTISSPESKITEFSFVWLNFSKVQGSQIIIGDVFQVPNFFGQVFGEAALQMSYPQTFSVKSVSPPPYTRVDSDYYLRWSRTQDLDNGDFQVVLELSQNENGAINDWQPFITIVSVSIGILIFLFVFYAFKRRRNNLKPQAPLESSSPSLPFVSEEEKVLLLLKSAGSMKQSQIAERTRFSKAKTSQLLAGLEKKGAVTRYKSGRDKIVTLNERAKSE